MSKSFTALALIAVLFAAGCASQAEFLNNHQSNADADGRGPRTIRDELSTGHPGHYFARSRPARPPRALDEMDSNAPNTRSASPAAADAKRSSSCVRSSGMAVLPPAPEDSTIGNRRDRSTRPRRGRPRRPPMAAVLHNEKKGEAHEPYRRRDRWSRRRSSAGRLCRADGAALHAEAPAGHTHEAKKVTASMVKQNRSLPAVLRWVA